MLSAARDPDRIKGVLNLAIAAILFAFAVIGFIVGRWLPALIFLVIGSGDLYAAYLYFKRGGQLLRR